MNRVKTLQILCIGWLISVALSTSINRDRYPTFSTTSEVDIVGTVISIKDQSGLEQTVRLNRIGINEEVHRGLLEATVGGFPRLNAGDRVIVRCKIDGLHELTAGSFRYDRYLAKEGVIGVCRAYGSPNIVGASISIRSVIVGMRDRFAGVLRSSLSEPHVSLLEGLLYGARSTLPKNVLEAFRKTGTMHIVAVSGFNIVVVSSLLQRVLIATFFSRKNAFWIVIAGIVVFVLMTGGDAAIMRAAIMGGLVLIARQIGRPFSAVTFLLVAATLMTIMNPRILLDDVGFHLSFAAVMGLMFLGPKIDQRLRWIPNVNGFRTTIVETLAATVATMPVSLWHFGRVSLIGVVANVFIVPLVPYAMGLGFFGGLIALAVPKLGAVVLFPAYAVLELMFATIRTFSYM